MSGTPARVTRSRANTPGPIAQPKTLPSLQTKASTSYGSRGKATLQSQTAVTTSIGQFEDAFSTARNQAHQSTIPKRRNGKARAQLDESMTSDLDDMPAATPVLQTTSTFDDADYSRPSTSLDAGAMYEQSLNFGSSMPPPPSRRVIPGPSSPLTNFAPLPPKARSPPVAPSISGNANGAMLPPPTRRSASHVSRTSHKSSSARSTASNPEEEPSGMRVFFGTLARYFPELIHDANPSIQKWLMKWLGILWLLGLFMLAVSGIVVSLASVYSIIPLPASMEPPREHFVSGMKYAFGFATQEDILEQLGHASAELRRLEELKELFDESRKTLILQDEALNDLRRSLPEVVVVEKVNGKVQMTPEFWDAFEQKLTGNPNSPLWSAILRTHEHELKRMISSESKESFVSKEEYIELVRGAVDERFGDVLAKVEQTASRVAATVSREVTEEYMKKNAGSFTHDDRVALEKFTRIQAAYDSLNTVNFFEPGLGATVVPKLTSSTQKLPTRSWSQYLWSYHELILIPQFAPIEALTHLLDASSCWCAAPSADKKGKAQISIKTPLRFYPDTLVIEHIPTSGTLDISTAPKTFEVWAELESVEAVAHMRKKIAYFVGNDRTAECSDSGPTDKFICVYRGEYDIHFANPVQAFKLWYPIERLDLATDLISVRVTENWGGPWTCLYRLRMTGSRTDADQEFERYGAPKEIEEPECVFDGSDTVIGEAVQTVWH